jgi:hypothetical protein
MLRGLVSTGRAQAVWGELPARLGIRSAMNSATPSPTEIHRTVASGSPSSQAGAPITRSGEQPPQAGLLPHWPALYGA